MAKRIHRPVAFLKQRGAARKRSASQESNKKKDLWDKGAVISQFLSSVVLVLVGLFITSSIQRAQIASSEASAQAQLVAAERQAQNNLRLQEGQLAARLVQHLASKSSVEREIALVALKESVPEDTYISIAKILASGDEDPRVREAAIKELGESENPTASLALDSIARDDARPPDERVLARNVAIFSATRTALQSVQALFAATGPGGISYENLELGGSFFSHYAAKGLNGLADSNADKSITVSELQAYLSLSVPEALSREGLDARQGPSVTIQGKVDYTLVGDSAKHTKVAGVLVSLSRYQDPAFHDLMKDENIALIRSAFSYNENIDVSNFKLLENEQATREAIRDALLEAVLQSDEDTLLVFYYAGHGFSAAGQSFIVAYDTEFNEDPTSSAIPLVEVNDLLSKSSAMARVAFFDSCRDEWRFSR